MLDIFFPKDIDLGGLVCGARARVGRCGCRCVCSKTAQRLVLLSYSRCRRRFGALTPAGPSEGAKQHTGRFSYRDCDVAVGLAPLRLAGPDFRYTKISARPGSEFIYTKIAARPGAEFYLHKPFGRPGSGFYLPNLFSART